VPVPGSAAPTPCVTFDALGDVGALVAHVAATVCDAPPAGAAPFLAGVEACQAGACGAAFAGGTALPHAELAAPAGYFDALAAADPGAPELILGVQAVILAFALDASPDELAQGAPTACPEGDVVAGLARLWPSREHVLATKRVTIRGPLAPDEQNENPIIEELVAGVTTLDPAAATTVAGGTVPLRATSTDADHQLYTKLDAAGLPIETAREEWVYSWFSTAGELDELHTAEGESDEWIVGGTPDGARALVAAVVRDLRGGVGWAVREVRVVR
jgi:hypothetical protein